jgi:acyl-CoA synthetase (AMP-forming)/AMP-acid ligase II
MLTHANIMGNQAAIQAASRQTADSVFLTWLPLFHDMGLMGMVLQPIYVGAPCVLMPPRAFLRRPIRWLKAIQKYRATISGGPNFAFDLCLARISDEDRLQLDLSSWEVAYNGAEPVSAETMRRFAKSYAPHGLDPASLYPCYGLAEATAFYTGGHREGLRVLHHEGRPLVACGFPHAGHRLAIVDPVTMQRKPGETVGEIWLAGPSVGIGYWNRPEATEATFGASIEGQRWLRTGDLGYIQQGQVVVCGRLKDLLIIRGRNHYPQDLEATVRQCHPALALGEGTAFTVESDGEAQLVLVHEVKPAARAQASELLTAIRQAIATGHGLKPVAIALIKWGSLPKTSSGKVQRAACRTAYMDGALDVVELERRLPAVSRSAVNKEQDA